MNTIQEKLSKSEDEKAKLEEEVKNKRNHFE